MEQHLGKLGLIPKGVTPKQALRLLLEQHEALVAAIKALANGDNLTLGAGLRKGQGHGRMMVNVDLPRGRSYGGAADEVCPFGEIIDVADNEQFSKAVSGGVVLCGDKNFNVPWYGIPLPDPPEEGAEWDTSKDGTWLVEVSVSEIEFSVDDAREIILPGIITASGDPEWNKIEVDEDSEDGTDYSDNINPETPGDTGTITIPIGILTVFRRSATLSPVACGMVKVDQCSGILNHTRISGTTDTNPYSYYY